MLVGYGPPQAPPSRRRAGSGRRTATGRRSDGAADGGRSASAGRAAGALHGAPERGRPGRRRPATARAASSPARISPRTWPARRPLSARGRSRRRETRGAPVRGVQKHMAEAMVRSVATAPQACVFLTVDVTPTMRARRRGSASNRHFEGLRVTPLAVVARAVVLALRDHPALNSSWDDAADEVVTKHYVNLGIAVAGPLGLVVPNIKDAQD